MCNNYKRWATIIKDVHYASEALMDLALHFHFVDLEIASK
jgi:hypothetical protein